MFDHIRPFLDAHGFVTRSQVFRTGGDDHTIADWLRNSTLVRIGPGLYASKLYRALPTREQHLVRARAVATRFDDRVAFSHQTAALIYGMATWGVDLGDVHVTRLDTGRARRHAGVTHHRRSVEELEIHAVQPGITATSPARVAWDIATCNPVEASLVTIDSGLRMGLFGEADLRTTALAHGDWPGARRAKVSFCLATDHSDSPGETRLRYLMYRAGIPKPVPQFPIYRADGSFIGRTDFAWPEYRHIAEFDGLMKYSSSGDLAKEKAREDDLRRAGWGVTRIVWSQLAPSLQPALVDELRRALADSRQQFGHLAA